MAYITCKDLTLGYEGHAIVSDLNFKVSKGDYLCIVGENGTGKSTLIKTLLHLQDAISGDIITGDGLKAYEVGYLPQQTVVQKDFPATVDLERGNVVVIPQGVDTVIHGDIADTVSWEKVLNQMPGLQIVTPQSAEVFRDDKVDLPALNGSQHSL